MTDTLTTPADTPPAKPASRPSRDRFRVDGPAPRVLQWVIVVLLVAGGVSFIVKGADGPPDPYLRAAARTPVDGFGEIAFRIDKSGDVNRCALLAQTSLQQARGLMGRKDLAGYDGMLFVYPADTNAAFFMKGTPLPLSIAWFDSGGRFVSSTDMEPCLDRPDCPLFTAAAAYRYALEVKKGGLPALGVGQGAVLSVGGPCA